MRRPLWHVGLVPAVLVAVGCSEKADSPPTGPEFHTVINKSSGCDLQHLSQLVNSYFGPDRQKALKPIMDGLAGSQLYSTAAKGYGFDIMAHADSAVKEGSAGTTSIGSDMLNHLLLCIYNPGTINGVAISKTDSLSYPETFPEDFTVALSLTDADHGAFGERSGSSVSAVLSRPLLAPYTGVAPPTGTTQWGNVVTSTPARVVFYGRPVLSDPTKQTYEWKSIPHNASFNPGIIMGFCVDHGTTMVLELGVAVLAFADAYFLNPAAAGTCSPDLSLLDGTNPFQLAHRLLRFGRGLLTPRPLMAAILNPGGAGTRKVTCCSKVKPTDVLSVSATLSNVSPNRIKVNTGRFSITAKAFFGTDPVNGTKVVLSTKINSGTNTFVKVAPTSGPCSNGTVPEGITGSGANPAGTYVFTNLCFTNTGNVYVLGDFNNEGRSDAPVQVQSNKINVIP